MKQSSLPPDTSTHLTRKVFHPYGRGKNTSFTISLDDTGLPGPDGKNWILYRFFQHVEGGPRKGTVLFSGQVPWTEHTGQLAKDLVDRLTDPFQHASEELTKEQRSFLSKHAKKLREEANSRVSWKPADIKTINTSLEASHEMRDGEHRYRLGLLEGVGETSADAKRALIEAISAHISYPVQVRKAESGNVYVMCPHGSKFVARLNDEPWITLSAETLAQAEASWQEFIEEHETEKVETIPPKAPRKGRPSIRVPA
jgi:predicted RNase H-like HicB family nuclease